MYPSTPCTDVMGAIDQEGGVQRTPPLYIGSKSLVYFPEKWEGMVQTDYEDHGASLCFLQQTLEKASRSARKSMNHHSDALIEIAMYVCSGDYQNALTLISDRLQFNQMLGNGKPLNLCTGFYRELREGHISTRVKKARLNAYLTTPTSKARDHARATLLDEEDPTDQEDHGPEDDTDGGRARGRGRGGRRRGGRGRRF